MGCVPEAAFRQAGQVAERPGATRFDTVFLNRRNSLGDLAMYLRQPAPDQALDRAAAAFLERDRWSDDPLW
jgi:hypothetical protein